ncbi:MAG: hypothetical protein ACKVW3_05875, partial [Phycisphaerales bacterium]
DDRQPILAGKDWTVAVPGARSIRFIATISGGGPMGEVTLDSPWSVIRLLHDPRARIDPADPKCVFAPVPYTYGGKEYVLVVRLKFSKPVPKLEDWPTWDAWFKPGSK